MFTGFNLCNAQENILENGGFEDGVLEPWTTYGNATFEVVTELVGADVPEDPIEGDYCVYINVPNAGTNFWDVWFKYPGLVFESGKRYTFSAFVKCATGTLQAMFKPELDQAPNTGYGAEELAITDEWQELYVTTPNFTANVSPADVVFLIAYEAGEFWIDGVRFYEGTFVPTVLEIKRIAQDPVPEDGAVDVPRDIMLSWTPGPFAKTHNLYLGTDFDDVNNADTDSSLNVLTEQGLMDAIYDPGLLEYGQTYYWRVDEVNAPSDPGVFKGDIWSFMVEPLVYPIDGGNIIATASSFEKGKGPENTVNGSGLSDDLHSTATGAMWLSLASEPNTVWIKYEFDKIYELTEMWVWNYNAESILSLYGLNEVTVEYSLDGSNWTKLDNIDVFEAAPGADDYAHNTTVDFNNASAKFVRINAVSNQGGGGGFFNQYGLSEVKFFYIPLSAREPYPENRAANIPLDVTLSWRAGRGAISHDVYVADNIRDVINRTGTRITVSEPVAGPLDLDLSTTYYWSVDEVNGADLWESDIWNFTTQEFFVLDDFEDYNDFPPHEIWNTWIDGFENPDNGSTAGYPDPDFTFGEHFVETDTVHGGRQSMPYFYDNSTAPKSEVTRTIISMKDWTQKGISSLSMWYYGDATNAAEPMYVTLNGSATVYNPDSNAAKVTDWTSWSLPLQQFADQGLNLANISSMTIGFGDGLPGGSGLVFFDDIRLYGR